MTARVTIDVTNSENIRNYASPVHVTLLNATTTVTNMCIGGVVLSALTYIHWFPATTSMKQHVYLCVIGYVLIICQAVQCLNPHAGWARLVIPQNRIMIHWTLQIVGSILVICGTVIRICSLSNNFSTTHGILGFTAMLLAVLNMVCGVVNIYSNKLKINVNIMKIVHPSLGCLTLCCAFLALCFAFNNSYRFFMGNQNADIAIGLSIIALVGTLLSPCIEGIKRILKK